MAKKEKLWTQLLASNFEFKLGFSYQNTNLNMKNPFLKSTQ